MARSTLIGGVLWSCAVAGLGAVAASGAVDGFGPGEFGSGAATTTTTTAVAAPPVDPAAAPAAEPLGEVPATTEAPAPVDRTAEYLDAMVADTMESFDESARPVVVCVSEGILAAVGGAAVLEAAGVSPQLFGVADDLTELGIAIDPAAVDAVATSAASCGLGGLLAAELVTGMTEALRQVAAVAFGAEPQRVVDEADAACVREQLSGDGEVTRGFAVAFVLGDADTADRSFAASLGRALAACPHTFVPFFLEVARASGLRPTAEGQACIEAEVLARSDRLAAAFSGATPEDAEAVAFEVFEACQGTFEG